MVHAWPSPDAVDEGSSFRDKCVKAYRFMLLAFQYCSMKETAELTDDLARIVDREMLRSRGAVKE